MTFISCLQTKSEQSFPFSFKHLQKYVSSTHTVLREMSRLEEKGKGDLFVIVEVRTPTHITPQQRTLLEKLSQLEKEKLHQE